MTASTLALERLLGQVFDDCREGLRRELPSAEYDKRRHDFIFHMLDWHGDMERLNQIFHHPEGQDIDSASHFLIGFLYHVIPHLSAAGRLLLDRVPDPFSTDASDAAASRLSREPS